MKIRQWVFNMSNILSAEEREERRLPQSPEEVNAFGMVWFVEFISTQPDSDFMKANPTMTSTDLDHEEFHDMQLKCKRIRGENEHIHISTFEEEDNPDIPKDPNNKKEIEHMTPENKQLILEIDNSALIDCTVPWMNMLNKDLQKKIVKIISTETKKKNVDDQETTKEPVVPPAKMASTRLPRRA